MEPWFRLRFLLWQRSAGKQPLRRSEVRVLSGRATQLLPIQLQELTLLPEAESFLQLILSHPYLLTYAHPQDRRKTLPLELCLSTQKHGPYSPTWITFFMWQGQQYGRLAPFHSEPFCHSQYAKEKIFTDYMAHFVGVTSETRWEGSGDSFQEVTKCYFPIYLSNIRRISSKK